MTVAVLRPDGLVYTVSAAASTGTINGTLSDNSDSTYTAFTPDAAVFLGLGTVTLPAGAYTSQARVRFRAHLATPDLMVSYSYVLRKADGTVLARNSGTVSAATTTVRAFVFGYEVLPVLTQAEVDGLGLEFNVAKATDGSTSVLRMAEAYVDLVYAEVPVAAVTAPAEAAVVTTSRPTVTWTHTAGSGGGAQTHYQVVIASAAEYGAVGFDPGSSLSTVTYRIFGGAAGSVTSHTPTTDLANSTTYRAYVRTAQTVNGTVQYGAWDYNTFSTSFTVATISSVTATASNSGGYNTVVVARSGGTAWDAVTIQRLRPGATSWEILRGGDTVTAVNEFVTAWSTSSVTIRDYEAGNGESVTYAAKAHRVAGSADVWSPFVQSSSVAWTSTEYWLKNPHDPTLNTNLVAVRSWSGMQRPRAKAVHHVESREDPIVISGTLHTINGTTLLRTLTLAGAAALEALFEATDVVLVQTPDGGRIGSVYIAGLEPTEVRVIDNSFANPARFWEVSFVEVAAPADQT